MSRKISAIDLETFMVIFGIQPQTKLILDENYVRTTKKWFLTEGAKAIEVFRDQFEFHYKKEARDCENFGALAWWLLQELHASTHGSAEAGLAICEFAYVRRDGVKHDIIGALVMEGGELEMVWMEPQTSKEVKLTPQEIRSCLFYRF